MYCAIFFADKEETFHVETTETTRSESRASSRSSGRTSKSKGRRRGVRRPPKIKEEMDPIEEQTTKSSARSVR